MSVTSAGKLASKVTLCMLQIFACSAEVEEILPFVKAFHALVRRRPFLVQRLEEVLKKLLTSLEFFDTEGRKKIAIGVFRLLANSMVSDTTTPPHGLAGVGKTSHVWWRDQPTYSFLFCMALRASLGFQCPTETLVINLIRLTKLHTVCILK